MTTAPASPAATTTASKPPDIATRRWRLRGYSGTGKDQKMVHQSTCRGDRGLDDSMKSLEANASISRITVEPV